MATVIFAETESHVDTLFSSKNRQLITCRLESHVAIGGPANYKCEVEDLFKILLGGSEASMSPEGFTPSERFVTQLCQRSFLRLWTHPNPKGKKGKELCDCLIVCGPHIVILSVKDNEYRETGDSTGWERWTKAAIQKSQAQIFGAERWLKSSDEVVRSDGRVISLPDRAYRQYHRVAIALGARGKVPLQWGDSGKGFVHVCDEYSLGALFLALDTITDFVGFLMATEDLVRDGTLPLLDGGGIEDLVALYFQNRGSFQFDASDDARPDLLVLQGGLWSALIKSDGFVAKRQEFSKSYVWDRLIDHFADDLLTEGMFDMHSQQVTDNELALVTMAIQPRAARSVLARAFREFLEDEDLNSAARVVQGHGNTAFVFTIGPSTDREFRAKQLGLRCLVVRGRLPGVKTVVGIATDRPGSSKVGYSSDIVYIHMPNWSEEDKIAVVGIQNNLGYFKNVSWNK